MKTFLNLLLCAGLLSLLAAAPLRATSPDTQPDLPGWVSAPDASFNARTYQHASGDLIVQVNNPSLRGLTIQMQTMRGEAIAYVPVPQQQSQLRARLDVSELTDGDYRIIVATDTGKIVKIVTLTTAAPKETVRQATVAVVTPVPEH